MTRKLCCPECFDDRFLRDEVFPFGSHKTGVCDFCGAKGVALLEPGALLQHFEPLVDIYEIDEEGKSLAECLKEDWLLFSRLDAAHAKELLVEILDDGEVVRKSRRASAMYTSENLANWETFRDEIKWRNRWWLDENMVETLEKLITNLESREPSNTWCRARISRDGSIFPIDQMGAPPRELGAYGRANPVGITYLYLASDADTAIAEIRPHTGDLACVGQFEVREIQTVDLRHPRRHVSPFGKDGISEIGQLLAELPLLERLGKELTQPILPHVAAIDYIPSQYLCEFIKKRGYDGVVYRSSVGTGFNLALFNPDLGFPKSVTGYVVRKVSVDVEPVPRSPRLEDSG